MPSQPADTPSPASTLRRVALLLGPGLLVGAMLLPAPAGMSDTAWLCAALALWMALWWGTEAIAIPATALLPLLFAPIIGLSPLKAVAAAYAHPIVFLFMGGFMLGLAMQRWQLHRRLALTILCRVGAEPRRQIAGFMVATAFLSMWVSNTATSVMMLPIAMSVIGLLPESLGAVRRNYAIALLLAIAYSASIGGMATLIGTPPNALLAAYLQSSHGIEVGFAQWMGLALPLSLAMLAICWRLLCRRDFSGVADYSNADISRQALREMGPITTAERRVAIVFCVAAAAWIGRPFAEQLLPGLSDTGIALAAALSLFVIRSGVPGSALLDWKTTEKLPWGVLLLFGGGLALAALIGSSGLAEWIASRFEQLAALPLALILLLIVSVMIFLTELTSNTATTAAFLPLLGALAVAQGISPLLFCCAAALAASCAFMMPVATPPNAVIFGSGELEIRDMMRAGFALNLLGIALVSLCSYGVITLLWLAQESAYYAHTNNNDNEVNMNIPMICIAVLGLLCFVLGLNVSIARTKAKRGSGCPDDPKDPLHKAIRAHANTVEYAPALMVLIYIASQAQMALWVMWTMVAVTACRVLFVLGILTTRTMARPNPMRFIGALGTYAGGIALAVEVLFQAMGWRVM